MNLKWKQWEGKEKMKHGKEKGRQVQGMETICLEQPQR